MINTVPRTLTAGLVDFCRTLSTERPIFIRSRPSADAQLSTCFDNVARKIDRAGGGIDYGWAIWNLKGVYFEAEHHGVWRNRQGTLIDVSPQFADARKLLFLPDSSAVYDPKRFRANVIRAEVDSPDAREIVELSLARNVILNRYRAGGMTPAGFSHSDQLALNSIEARMKEIWPRLVSS